MPGVKPFEKKQDLLHTNYYSLLFQIGDFNVSSVFIKERNVALVWKGHLCGCELGGGAKNRAMTHKCWWRRKGLGKGKQTQIPRSWSPHISEVQLLDGAKKLFRDPQMPISLILIPHINISFLWAITEHLSSKRRQYFWSSGYAAFLDLGLRCQRKGENIPPMGCRLHSSSLACGLERTGSASACVEPEH